MTEVADLAYAAGIVDGEGMVTIIEYTERANRSHPNRPTVTRQRPVVVVAMTDPAIPLWLQETFGGRTQLLPARNERHQPQIRWTITGDEAGKFCELVEPYLRLKRPQARLLADFCSRRAHWTSRGLPADELAARRRDVATFRALNARGVASGGPNHR